MDRLSIEYSIQQAPGKIQKPTFSNKINLKQDLQQVESCKQQKKYSSEKSMSNQSSETEQIVMSIVHLISREESQQNEKKPITLQNVYELFQWEIQSEFFDCFQKRQKIQLSHYYYELMQQFEVNQKPILQSELLQNGLYQINCNEAFVLFFKELQVYFDQQQLRYIILFNHLFRKTINQNGNSLLETNKILKTENQEENCQQLTPKDISELSNIMIVDVLPETIKQLKMMLSPENDLQQLLAQENLVQKISSIAFYFCNWLYAHKLSNHKLIWKDSTP